MSLMLRQTGAMFVDAYRELNARKLFWITLAISGLVVGAFAAIGLNDRGVTFLWWTFDSTFLNARVLEPNLLYKFAFANFAIPIWLAWGATILALVTTASMVPDFVAGGAIELAVSKPISRARLIMTKYITGLTFAGLQVLVFTLAAFVVIGVRGHSWELRLFWAVPIMLAFFSYLYSVCALLGLLTRSTIASLLLTLLFWLLIFGVHTTETIFLSFREGNELRIQGIEARIESLEAQKARQQEIAGAAAQSPAPEPGSTVAGPTETQPPDMRAAGAALALQKTESDLVKRRTQLESAKKTAKNLRLGHSISFAVKTVLPKTAETVALLDRVLLAPGELEKFRPKDRDDPMPMSGDDDVRVSGRAMEKRLQDAIRGRTVGWVVGTSLAFEGVVLLVMIWIFRRRDF
jgi:hypothetical protein